MSFLMWLKKSREWRRQHVAAFQSVIEQMTDGLTVFQHQCLAALKDVVPTISFERVESKEGAYLVATLDGNGTKVFIYSQEAGVWGPSIDRPLEEWSFKTPALLIQSLVDTCSEQLSPNQAFKSTLPKSRQRGLT